MDRSQPPWDSTALLICINFPCPVDDPWIYHKIYHLKSRYLLLFLFYRGIKWSSRKYYDLPRATHLHGASLVAQWLKIHLPMREIQVEKAVQLLLLYSPGKEALRASFKAVFPQRGSWYWIVIRQINQTLSGGSLTSKLTETWWCWRARNRGPGAEDEGYLIWAEVSRQMLCHQGHYQVVELCFFSCPVVSDSLGPHGL